MIARAPGTNHSAACPRMGELKRHRRPNFRVIGWYTNYRSDEWCICRAMAITFEQAQPVGSLPIQHAVPAAVGAAAFHLPRTA